MMGNGEGAAASGRVRAWPPLAALVSPEERPEPAGAEKAAVTGTEPAPPGPPSRPSGDAPGTASDV